MLRTDQVWPRTLAVYCDTGVLRIETVKERRRDVAARVVTKPISALHAEKATDFTMLARSLAQGPQKVPQVGVINDNDAAEQFIMAHSEISYNKMVYLISKESLDFRLASATLWQDHLQSLLDVDKKRELALAIAFKFDTEEYGTRTSARFDLESERDHFAQLRKEAEEAITLSQANWALVELCHLWEELEENDKESLWSVDHLVGAGLTWNRQLQSLRRKAFHQSLYHIRRQHATDKKRFGSLQDPGDVSQQLELLPEAWC